MLKMHHGRAHKGDTSELWEQNWEQTSFEDALRFCEVDPLRPLFERYARPGTVMLEGGCGQGQYVEYYSPRGVRVVGLDFAQGALGRLHARNPNLILCAGDVATLPFRDEVFDLYYSGGVVEHFEAGAEPALQAARRVLKRNGVLLCSVPYLSPLRRALAPGRKDWKRVSHAQYDSNNGSGDLFFQYAYTVREFSAILHKCGLRVVERQPYSVLWGLYEVPYLAGAVERLVASKRSAEDNAKGSTTRTDFTAREPALKKLVKRLIVSEDVSVPVAGLAVRFLRWALANMMMYVCERQVVPELTGVEKVRA